MNKRLQTLKYLFSDLLAGLTSWSLFFYIRKTKIEGAEFIFDDKLKFGLILIPLFWILGFFIVGAYSDLYRRFRIKEFGQTFLVSLIGSLILFFILVLDDEYESYKNYYQSFAILFGLHFGMTLIPRLILTSITVRSIHERRFGFPTIIIGGNIKALEIFTELEEQKEGQGFVFKGFVSLNGVDRQLKERLEHLGTIEDVNTAIEQLNIEEVIIAIESSEHDQLQKIINSLDPSVKIKVIPDMYDILSGSVKMTSILGAPLIEVNPEIMPPWQTSIKRLIDVSLSVLALTILSPMYLVIGICVKFGSKGPVFFKQERIGLHGKTFNIIKFRSMRSDAEKDGPQLSSDVDPRITGVGRFLRKTRLDEFPQFINVLKGDMSIVGPRPERQFYIEQIMQRAPHYKHLHKVRPGITSWGQVKYGYAENVDQMIQRLKYDLLYLENMSLSVDFKIMIYTIRTVLKGSGK